MKNIIATINAWGIMLCLVFMLFLGLGLRTEATAAKNESNFDTSACESWEGGFSSGRIRMLGAWFTENGNFETEDGNIWIVDKEADEGFYLVWIADNNTPDNIKDDIIIKIWAEAHD